MSSKPGPLEAAIARRMGLSVAGAAVGSAVVAESAASSSAAGGRDELVPSAPSSKPEPAKVSSMAVAAVRSSVVADAAASSSVKEMEASTDDETDKGQKPEPVPSSTTAKSEDSVPSSSATTAIGRSNEGQKPESVPSETTTKPEPNTVPSSSAKPNQSTNVDVSTRPKKKGKVEQHFLEIKWYEYDVDNSADINHSIFADEIPKGTKFAESRAFLKKYEGENHEYSLSLCLVDSKSEDRKVLVELDVWYWYLPINLMHFHILSQDLANFCRSLWVAAGKDEDVYDDMSIEFGYSKIGKVEVKKLVGTATGIKRKSDVLYVNDVKMHPGSTVQDSLKLLNMMFKLCKSAIVIAYEVDLSKLGIYSKYDVIGFTKMRKSEVFIGPTRKF